MQTHRAPAHSTPPAGQGGSVAINAVMALSLIIILLIGTELGYLFYQKRELQKAVDLAALAGAQSVGPTDCSAAQAAAKANANGTGPDDGARNLPSSFVLADADVVCGRWDPAVYPDDTHFSPGTTSHNAVRVLIQQAPPSLLPFFPGQRTIRAQAIAAVDDPLAAFSVGSTLVRVGDSLLGDLLKGIGLDLSGTSLVGYDGLAQARITPRGLLQALGIPVAADIGVGELNNLLAARTVELGTLLDAIVTVAGQDSLLGTNIGLLNAIQARLGISDLMVQLGSLANPSGLFALIDAPNADSALNVEVNALDLLYSAIGVATKNHAVELNLGVANLVKTRVAVIEPPSIAIGGVGATAYTAQVRTYVDVDTGSLPLIGSLARVKLPIMIDLVNGKGTLTEMCTPGLRDSAGNERAEIAVDASIAKICVGRPGANPSQEDQIFSTSASCEDNLADEELLKLSLLGINLVSLKTHFDIDALPLNASVTLAEGQTQTVGNNLLLGSTIRNVTDALLTILLGEALDRGPTLSSTQRQAMAQQLWDAQGAACGNRACRQARLATVKNNIENASSGLGGFVGGLTSDTLNIVNELLTLDVLGLLNGIGNLVGGLLQTVGNVLGGVLGILTGHPCTGGGLFNAPGSDSACVSEIAGSLDGSSSSGSGGSAPNAIVALVGFLLNLLQPILDAVGSAILTPLLRDVLGLNLGQIDVHLQSLNCQAQARLVY